MAKYSNRLKLSLILICCAATVFSQSCLPIEQDCSFYPRCLEAQVPCGPDGYALGFGLRYCNKFKEHHYSFSPRGRLWLWSTMKCLQNALIPVANGQVTMTCPEIRSFAITSHAPCYTQPGQSICQLPLTDWTRLFVIIVEELNDPATWALMLEVLNTCRTGGLRQLH